MCLPLIFTHFCFNGQLTFYKIDQNDILHQSKFASNFSTKNNNNNKIKNHLNNIQLPPKVRNKPFPNFQFHYQLSQLHIATIPNVYLDAYLEVQHPIKTSCPIDIKPEKQTAPKNMQLLHTLGFCVLGTKCLLNIIFCISNCCTL